MRLLADLGCSEHKGRKWLSEYGNPELEELGFLDIEVIEEGSMALSLPSHSGRCRREAIEEHDLFRSIEIFIPEMENSRQSRLLQS